VALVAPAVSVLLLACGHRATHEDCQLIVDKSVELQMAKMSLGSAADVRHRVEQVRGQLQTDIASCEGRRVTDGMMACVQSAKAPQELEQCLR
jgi:hypothetical protein